MNGDPRPEPQGNVQRLLGHCMLRIQQYERLMKATWRLELVDVQRHFKCPDRPVVCRRTRA